MSDELDHRFSFLKEVFYHSFKFDSLSCILVEITVLLKSAENRKRLSPSHWHLIADITKVGCQVLWKKDRDKQEMNFVEHLLRLLRNSCGGSVKHQSFILNVPDVIEFAKKPLELFLQREDFEEFSALKICIQLFGNILVGNESSKPVVWRLFSEENAFNKLLKSKDETVVEYTMMVLYNCMSEETIQCLLSTREGLDIVVTITSLLLIDSNDWGMLFIEYLLKKSEFLQCCYNDLPLENRLLILDIINEHLKFADNEEIPVIPIDSVEYIKNHFLNRIKGIVQLCNINNSDMEPSELVRMLSLLCSASVCNHYIPYMRSSKDLLGKCIETLKCIHLLGKQSPNVFSAVNTLAQTNIQCKEQIECHPLYGFKRDLIRLIGNLCCNCKENQDLVREKDGIPLVLDCCKLDSKNPYIMQWCILAIRNIMEHNQENQAVLASITTTGEIVDSSLLNEIGIRVCIKNGKLSVS